MVGWAETQGLITRYSLRIAPINDAQVRLAGRKAYENKRYPILLKVDSNHSLCPSIPKLTDLICLVHQDPICAVYLQVHSNHSLCPSIHKFNDLACSVHQYPSHQKVASVWAYICSILRLHSNHSLCLSIPKFNDLICSVHKEPSRQNVASFLSLYLQYT